MCARFEPFGLCLFGATVLFLVRELLSVRDVSAAVGDFVDSEMACRLSCSQDLFCAFFGEETCSSSSIFFFRIFTSSCSLVIREFVASCSLRNWLKYFTEDVIKVLA